ncbi:tape measure domain-containing protein [Carboxydocella sporoproducens DSM 16521]|uniref:Tape measure domain-containing protein n=2 Tax=Carboxydocella TaxID=178898 RepID=A0A1T4QFZ0_9FIRM|nr:MULTISPECIES: tape measure protein [Carboxydocella]AVX21591.1 tape measure domain-containing protein [Carboxydocella thermautotrophica]SKA02622.1 tape measure domain-containing protein [Carboxydocella sporoproducens DSM 16521]
MAQVGELFVRLTARTSDFHRALDEAKEKLNRVASSAGEASAAAAAFVGAISAAAAAAAGFGIKLAAEWEQTEMAFTTLLGSGEKAKAFLEDLDAFAARTPFELQGLTEASRKLLAFGFSAKQIIPMMTAIGDAVAALGGGQAEISRVTLALGQMQAKGKVSAEEMMQLAELGIPAWEMLARAIGTSIPEAMKLAEKGAISGATGINAILAGMEKRFAGAMDKQSKTMLGLWSTIKDQLIFIMRSVGQELIDAFGIKDIMQQVANELGNLTARIRQLKNEGHSLREAIMGAFSPEAKILVVALAGAIVGALVPALLLATKAAIALLASLGPFMLQGAAIATTAYLIYKAWRDAGGGIAAVGVFILRVIGSVVRILSLLIPPLAGVADRIFAYSNTLGQASNKTAEVGNKIKQQQQAIAGAGQKAAQSQQQLGKAVEGAGKKAGKNLQAFDQVYTLQEDMAEAASGAAANMAMPQVAAPNIAAPKIPDLSQATGPIGELAKKWDELAAAMEKARPILEAIGYIVAALMLGKFIKLAAEVGSFIGKLLPLGRIMQFIAEIPLVKRLLDISWALGLFGRYALAVVGYVARMAASWIAAIGPIGWLIAAVIALAVVIYFYWDEISAWTKQKWSELTAWLSQTWGNIKAWADAKFNEIVNAIAQDWEKIKTGAINAWNAIGNYLSQAWENIKSWAAQKFLALVTGIGQLWADLKTGTVEKWNTIANYLSQAWDNIKSWAGSKWGALTDTIKSSTAAATQWVADKWTAAKNTISELWDSLKQATKSKWDGITGVLKSAVNGIIGFINKLIDVWNSLKFTVPKITLPGGRSFGGFSVGVVQLPKIPFLAKGGIVTGPTLAMVGEAGPEAVVPLSGSRGAAFADQIAQAVYVAVRDALRMHSASNSGEHRQQEIVLEIDGNRIGRALFPALTRESQRLGRTVIIGG